VKRCLLFLLLLAAYSNHFGNGFHFDDSDAVENNPAIRSLTGIPRFFTEALLRFRPDLAVAHYNLGIAFSKLPGRLPYAIQHYQEAVRIDPNYTDAHTNLGVALTQVSGRFDDAVAELETAARLAPDSPKTHANLAIVLAQRRN